MIRGGGDDDCIYAADGDGDEDEDGIVKSAK